jgi:nitrate reductase molybdenum cofactor assembly chaperone
MAETTHLWEALAQVAEYPAPALRPALDALVDACSFALPEAAAEFRQFSGEFDRLGLARFEELYSAAFDFEASSSPYVGYHIFGEDPKRSLFMARLMERYREQDLAVGVELPDHLAAIFRLLATVPEGEEAADLVADCLVPAVERMRAGLEGRDTPYRGLLRAISQVLEEQAKPAPARREIPCRPFSLSSSPTSR